MPYRLTWEPFGVYREYFGDVTLAERRASLDGICGDHRFDDLRYGHRFTTAPYRVFSTLAQARDWLRGRLG